jgi:type II restriction enzyme
MEKITKEERIKWLVSYLPQLSEGQVIWVERIVYQFTRPRTFIRLRESDLISNESILEDFGDALRIHHCFTDEPFTKDKFEYVLVNVCKYYGLQSEKLQNNNPGEDVAINGQRYSLKTQADKNLRTNSINIHKFMELGKGDWTNKEEQLKGLTNQFLHHLGNYEKIIVLRNIGTPTPGNPYWKYELVEIPKSLLLQVKNGVYKMMSDSIQIPKPGYCRIYDEVSGELKFELYFDGGTERKLKINKINKQNCIVHATWEFIVKELDEALNQEKGNDKD